MLFSVATAALAALSLASPVDAAQFVIPAATLASTRIDPIVNPGTIGGHVHSLMGASNIRDVLNTPEEQLRAQCSSAKVQDDKSSYWVPTLYYIRKDGTYEGMAHQTRVYYTFSDQVTPWPSGMRIVTGDAMNRNMQRSKTRGIKMDFAALPRDKWEIYLPNTTTHPGFPGGPRAGIAFPSCGWANQSLDSDDHWSHLAWPIKTGGGTIWEAPDSFECPASHPIRYPGLFIETNYYPSPAQEAEWGTRSNHFIFSNGDMLGTSYHADFVNGWKPEVLAQALKTCNVGENLAACAAFQAGGTDDTTKNNCRFQGMIPAEQNGYQEPLQHLPGCNPEWPADAGDEKPSDCPWLKATPGFTPPNAFWSESHLEQTMPLAVEMDPRGEANWDNFTKVAGKNGKLSAWGEDQGWGRFFKFLNKASVMIGTAQDVADNLNMDTAVFKNSQVPGMQDASAWNGMQPPTIVGEGAHRVLQVPSGVGTRLANGGGIPTDVPIQNNAAETPAANASTPAATPAAGNASNPEATPAPAPAPAPNAVNGTGQVNTEQPSANASSSDSAGTPAGSPAASPSASGPVPSGKPLELPGGANNLVAHEDGADVPSAADPSASAAPSEAAPSASAAPSEAAPSAAQPPASTGTKAAGGHKKCSRRRRRSGLRLH